MIGIIKKIYWVSKHPLTVKQEEEIREIFGDDVKIGWDHIHFATPGALIRFIDSHPRKDEIVCVSSKIPFFLDVLAREKHKFLVFNYYPKRHPERISGFAGIYQVVNSAVKVIKEIK